MSAGYHDDFIESAANCFVWTGKNNKPGLRPQIVLYSACVCVCLLMCVRFTYQDPIRRTETPKQPSIHPPRRYQFADR